MTEDKYYGLFNDSFPPVLDGVTLTVENYCKWLLKSGRKVCVVTPWAPDYPGHIDLLQQDTFKMYRYLSLPIYNRHPYRYGYPKLDPFIWHKIKKTPFRIVHAHCPFSSGRLAAYAAKTHGIPLVTTFHSKYRTDLERSLPPFMVKYQMSRLLQFYNSATEVWIPQAAVEETLREYGFTGSVRVMDNGNDFIEDLPDIDVYRKESRSIAGIGDGEIGLLFVGQHILEKGVDVIIKALSLLKDVRYRMNFIGTGYAETEMKALAAELGISDKITFNGVIDNREKLRRFYAGSDIFLFPSYYDNAPLVVREAAAMKTPSILPSGSTAAEHIENGVNGFLSARTPEAYAQLIKSLADDPEKIRSVGEEAQRTLARSWHNVMNDVIDIYEDIIARYEYRKS